MKQQQAALDDLARIIKESGLSEEDMESLLCRSEGHNINGLVVTRVGSTIDGKGIWRILKASTQP